MKKGFTIARFGIEGLLIITFATLISCTNYTRYLSGAATGQLTILAKSKPITKVLQNTNLPDSVRQKLKLIEEIRTFAFTTLGLNPTNNYSKLYDQQGQPLLWVVTASKEFALQPKLWWFPVVGNVSYKGYFKPDEADDEANRLAIDGYESRVREVNAWSTLGWFNDPVMSSMLDYNEADLAELLIHELSHSTIYVGSNVDLSESLANFIGMRGAMLYLASKYGDSSPQYLSYVNDVKDIDRFDRYMLRAATQLDSLYATFTPNQDKATKRTIKKAFIGQIINNLDTVAFINKQYNTIYKNKPLPNNAYFIIKRQYSSKMSVFETECQTQANNNLVTYIAQLKQRYKKRRLF